MEWFVVAILVYMIFKAIRAALMEFLAGLFADKSSRELAVTRDDLDAGDEASEVKTRLAGLIRARADKLLRQDRYTAPGRYNKQKQEIGTTAKPSPKKRKIAVKQRAGWFS